MEPDFSGIATKAGVECTDGLTIQPGAFKHQHGLKVPLVWQHGHASVKDVLGHAILTYRENGDVLVDAYFNDTDDAKHAKGLVQHGDINQLSIWANQLVKRGKSVLHGAIREVSLVLAGANPGAVIEAVTIRHADGEYDTLEEDFIITTGEQIVLAHADDTDGDSDDGDDDSDDSNEDDEDGETLQDIYDNMDDKQKDVVHYMVGRAIAGGSESDDDTDDGDAKQDSVGDADDDDNISHDNSDKDGTDMTTRNLFENDGKGAGKDDTDAHVLSHADVQSITLEASQIGSLRKAVQNHALAHGIENIEILFPEAQALTNSPEWDKRRTEWVAGVLSGTRKSPFSRVKTWTADLTFEQARAKGYVKGDMKKEEWFSVAKRETGPQTIYKKQKLDRDDIIDITDFDIVAWMKGEMRLMLDEEIARAILVGDGRDIADPDKIFEDKIRPIASDDPYYTVQVGVNLDDADSTFEEVMDAAVLNREQWKGSGMPTFYTTETYIARALLLRDDMNRKLYRSVDEIATEMRVDRLVACEVLDEYPDTIGIFVNLSDYVVGTDRGGQVTMFDDFDIDFNQEKYLLETRLSGALTKPRTALHFYKTDQADVQAVAAAPTWDGDTWTVTIPVDANVDYIDQDGDPIIDGASVLTAGQVLNVQAVPAAGFYLAPGKTRWSFMRPSGT